MGEGPDRGREAPVWEADKMVPSPSLPGQAMPQLSLEPQRRDSDQVTAGGTL